MFLRSKQSAGAVVAVFDISSSSVGGAHALLTKGALPSILASTRIDASLQDDIDVKRFIDETSKNLSDVAHTLHKADIHHPDHVQLVLASPWYVSQTRSILLKKEQDFLCTKKLVDELVQKEIDYVVAHEFEWFGTSGKEGMVVEKQLSQIKLNGYPTTKPFGKRAQTIELSITITVVPKKIIDRFTDSLRRQYGTRHIAVTTSPYATFVTARDFLEAPEDSVILDIGEEVTDVAFIKDGLFLYQHSFPVGTYELYRSIVKSGATVVEAKALIEAYRLGKIGVTAKTKIDKALRAYAASWQEGLQKTLSGGQYGFCLPEHCYIVADARFEGVYPEIVAKDAFLQHACSTGKIQARFINANSFSDKLKSLDAELDVPLATGVLYAARIM